MARCRAPVFVGANQPLELQEFELPKLQPGEMLVRMRIAGICGTDVHMWRNPKTLSPMIFGHENVGEIVELAGGRKLDAVGQAIQEGDLVVFGGMAPCGVCHTCTIAGEPTVCENSVRYGTSPILSPPYLRGGYAEYVHLVGAAGIVRIPDEASIDRALLAVIGNRTLVHGFEKIGGLQAGDTVVVQGSGPIGLAALLQSRLSGANRILVIGAPKARLDLARELGASQVISIEEVREPEERIRVVREATEDHGADVVIEASGGSTAVEEGIRMTRIGGKYLIIGQATDYGARAINPYHLTRRQLRVYGSWAALPQHLFRAMQNLQGLELPMDRLITHRFPVEEATKGLETVDRLESIIGVIEHR